MIDENQSGNYDCLNDKFAESRLRQTHYIRSLGLFTSLRMLSVNFPFRTICDVIMQREIYAREGQDASLVRRMRLDEKRVN